MGRPPMPVGTHGKITTSRDDGGWYARTNVRDYDGQRRPVRRWGRTQASAERALKAALAERSGGESGGDITADTKVRVLAERWLARIEADTSMSINTKDTYRRTVAKHVLPGLGALRLREANVQAVDRALAAIRENSGHGSAKTSRSVLSGMLGLAARSGAIPSNPVRDAELGGAPVKVVRALTLAESEDLSDGFRSSQRAVELDLPDLVDWMLGTGMRIGEACAIRDDVLDLEAGTVEVTATLVRVRGVGMVIQERTKTDAGWRRLALPDDLVLMLRRRREELRLAGPREVTFLSSAGDLRKEATAGVVFISPAGHLRDPSNTAGDLREVLDALDFGWVTSHVFRKTVATRMDEAGLSARVIADQLGHRRPSMTQDVYMGRNVVSADAARVLARPAAKTRGIGGGL